VNGKDVQVLFLKAGYDVYLSLHIVAEFPSFSDENNLKAKPFHSYIFSRFRAGILLFCAALVSFTPY